MIRSSHEAQTSQFDYDKDFPPLPPPSKPLHTLKSSTSYAADQDEDIECHIPQRKRICSIVGRILENSDIGQYIIRPQPSYSRFGDLDMSYVPCQGMEEFTDIKLLKIQPDGKLIVKTEYKDESEAWFPNDGRWLTVAELKKHLDTTGEVLYKLASHRNFIF